MQGLSRPALLRTEAWPDMMRMELLTYAACVNKGFLSDMKSLKLTCLAGTFSRCCDFSQCFAIMFVCLIHGITDRRKHVCRGNGMTVKQLHLASLKRKYFAPLPEKWIAVTNRQTYAIKRVLTLMTHFYKFGVFVI